MLGLQTVTKWTYYQLTTWKCVFSPTFFDYCKFPNNPIGLLDGGGMCKKHSPMHRKNISKMPLMIRTRSGRAKESFQVWPQKVTSPRNTKVWECCTIYVHFTLSPFLLLLLLMNTYTRMSARRRKAFPPPIACYLHEGGIVLFTCLMNYTWLCTWLSCQLMNMSGPATSSFPQRGLPEVGSREHSASQMRQS